MEKLIIAIAGNACVGKDTVASMFNIINQFNGNITFDKWLIIKDEYENKIKHFAEPLKNVLSMLYNIPIEYLNNREYKDEYWFDLFTYKFIKNEDINLKEDKLLYIEDLIKQYNLNQHININRYYYKRLLIKIRTLLQYIGTNIIRKNLDFDIWSKSIINDCIKNLSYTNLICIADMRFIQELIVLNKITKDNDINLLSIRVNRIGYDNLISHESENIDFNCNIVIDNEGTLKDLFDKVLHLYNNVILPIINNK